MATNLRPWAKLRLQKKLSDFFDPSLVYYRVAPLEIIKVGDRVELEQLVKGLTEMKRSGGLDALIAKANAKIATLK